ncbi:hypothetical protein ABEF95_000678 [Exophiala dermatitidis]
MGIELDFVVEVCPPGREVVGTTGVVLDLEECVEVREVWLVTVLDLIVVLLEADGDVLGDDWLVRPDVLDGVLDVLLADEELESHVLAIGVVGLDVDEVATLVEDSKDLLVLPPTLVVDVLKVDSDVVLVPVDHVLDELMVPEVVTGGGRVFKLVDPDDAGNDVVP